MPLAYTDIVFINNNINSLLLQFYCYYYCWLTFDKFPPRGKGRVEIRKSEDGGGEGTT